MGSGAAPKPLHDPAASRGTRAAAPALATGEEAAGTPSREQRDPTPAEVGDGAEGKLPDGWQGKSKSGARKTETSKQVGSTHAL